ncbi:MAG: hypothetical protein JWQ79_1707 [Mucilaginibacter sp.]|nr:hypothetical protein [Mucilaginibacter sp.]
MKNLFIGCALFAALFILSCKYTTTTAKRTVIDGKIANFQTFPNDDKFTLTIGDFGGATTTYHTTVNKDGTFKFHFDQYIAQDVNILPLIRNFIVHPGDSIHIDLDYKKTGDVNFTGDAEKTNTDLYHYTTEYYSHYDKEPLKPYFMGLDTANYRAACENIRAEMLQKQQEFIDKYQPNDEVKNWTKNYINILYYNNILSFNHFFNVVQIRKNPGSKSIKLLSLTVPDKDLDGIYNTDLLNASSYDLLSYLMPPLTATTTKPSYAWYAKQSIIKIEKTNNSPLVKQLLIGSVFNYLLQQSDAEDFEKNQALFDSKITEPFIKQPLNNYYNAVKNNIANPQVNSNAILKKATGTAGKSLIDSIKNKHKNKVVYINFWATWCGPCIGEMPYEKKLEEKLNGKDVVFINVCLNSPKDLWLDDVAKFKLTGDQLFFDPKQSGKIRYGLDINAIPHHILIDKNGNITESSLHLRPGDPLTERKINTLLEQPATHPDPKNDGFKTIKMGDIK